MQKVTSQTLYKNIKTLADAARRDVVSIANTKLVETNFYIGKLIVEHEQSCNSRAEYAAKTLQGLSVKLTKQYGRCFSVDNLENIRKFYLLYKKPETVSRKSSVKKPLKLGWSHYTQLDLGQVQMYVNYFDENIKDKHENKTIGIVLCKNKKESIVKYTLPKNNSQIFASKYKMYLPEKDELKLLMNPGVPYGLNVSNESAD